MTIYCTGTITNNGTIDMTARGAKAEGQNVYLWKNMDNSYEFVPKVGAAGGNSVVGGVTNGIAGQNATNRQTGGGGSGAARHFAGDAGVSGAGTNGTSYSGGTRRRWSSWTFRWNK